MELSLLRLSIQVPNKEIWMFSYDPEDEDFPTYENLLREAESAERNAPSFAPHIVYVPVAGLPHVRIGLKRYCLSQERIRSWLRGKIKAVLIAEELLRAVDNIPAAPHTCRHAFDTSDI